MINFKPSLKMVANGGVEKRELAVQMTRTRRTDQLQQLWRVATI